MPKTKSFQRNAILIPLKRIPLIIPAMYGFFLSIFLPLYILYLQPDFIVMEPNVHIISALSIIPITRLRKIKTILDIRSIPVETVGLRGVMERFWFSVSVIVAKRFFDGMTIITPLMKREICENYDLGSISMGVWTSGVSEKVFDPKALSDQENNLRRKLGLEGKFVVFYHGTFSASRGLEETIDAIRLLSGKHLDIVLFLLGDGPILKRLQTLIQQYSLQESVIIHSPVEQIRVPEFIKICDVGIVPLPYNRYWRFQSPLKLLEYLSMGKVVILSDIPAHRLVTKDARCAIYLGSVSPREIADSIEYAYDNTSNLSSWGSIGRQIVMSKYTWAKVAKNLDDYLNNIGTKL